jgi:16S rRNA (uracil1498-N3)-methyltransferase
MRIVLSESEKDEVLPSLIGTDSEISIAIGPEGGWTDTELASFSENGWASASLGAAILRAETAAIAAVAVVLGCNLLDSR